MGGKITEIVEENIPQATAQNRPGDAPDHQVLDAFRRKPGEIILSRPVNEKPIGQRKGNDIHQAVIAKLEGSDLKKIRVDAAGQMLPPVPECVCHPSILYKIRKRAPAEGRRQGSRPHSSMTSMWSISIQISVGNGKDRLSLRRGYTRRRVGNTSPSNSRWSSL